MYQDIIIPQSTCCFTGHRRLPEQDILEIRRRLRRVIERLIDRNIDTFIAGGALGFDTLAAQEVLHMREYFHNIRLVLAVPCQNQDARWNAAQKTEYARIMAQADLVRHTGVIPSSQAMLARNRYMVDHSSCCICYLNNYENRGGTSYTVRYANSKGVPLVNLASGPDAPIFSSAEDEGIGEWDYQYGYR